MGLRDRIQERRDRLKDRLEKGEKGSVWFWFQIISIAYQLLRAFRG